MFDTYFSCIFHYPEILGIYRVYKRNNFFLGTDQNSDYTLYQENTYLGPVEEVDCRFNDPLASEERTTGERNSEADFPFSAAADDDDSIWLVLRVNRRLGRRTN